MLNFRAVAVSLAFGSLCAAGCGEDPETIPALLPEGGAAPTVKDAGSDGGCVDNSSQSCSCPNGSGTQTCYAGQWLSCACSSGVPVGTTGDCLAGQYAGSFKGDYRSGFAVLGLFSIPVEALDFSGRPGLAFTLNEDNAGGGATEFATYTISNGYVKGTANGVFPFEGILTGKLDCSTKKFTGELEGCYALGVSIFDANVGRFKGPVIGTYDVKTHTFTMGTWDIKEMNPSLGGTGSWNAAYKGAPTGNQMPMGAPACTINPNAVDGGAAGTPDASI